MIFYGGELFETVRLHNAGYFPVQVYSIEDSPLCLTGTAEVPLAGIHMDAILPAAQLPLRIAGYGRAFRTEAGSAGSASRGLYRLHQFSKVRSCCSTAHRVHERKSSQCCHVALHAPWGILCALFLARWALIYSARQHQVLEPRPN